MSQRYPGYSCLVLVIFISVFFIMGGLSFKYLIWRPAVQTVQEKGPVWLQSFQEVTSETEAESRAGYSYDPERFKQRVKDRVKQHLLEREAGKSLNVETNEDKPVNQQWLMVLIGAASVILLAFIGFLIYVKRQPRSMDYLQEVEQYVQEGKLDEAIAILKDTLSKNPRNAEAHAALGIIYNKKELLDDALSELKTAITIKPDLINVYQEMYLIYKKKGMEDEAKASLNLYEKLTGSK